MPIAFVRLGELRKVSSDEPDRFLDRPRGMSIVESLLALPVLLFSGFVIVQIGLLWHAKFAVSHAALIAARHASLHHGSNAAVRDGVVQGLFPLMGRAKAVSEVSSAIFKSGVEVTQGIAMGWIRWEVLSPTRQSFSDWGVPGDPILSPGVSAQDVEIPAHGVSGLAGRRRPASGVAEVIQGLPVGISSGQTLLEANNLKLHLQVGVPLQMPLAGPLLARVLGLWSGCGFGLSQPTHWVGLVNFGSDTNPAALHPTIECRALAAVDVQGRWRPRWPVEASAVVQMQSNARQSLMSLRDRQQSPIRR
ncbi:MAG: pilus assembly protein [Burkholderiaceae bacterium]|nr:pilus assembly protein [Burkholderiaceae bacterium]